jgi:BolA protein
MALPPSQRLAEHLRRAFAATHVQVRDDSAAHTGHPEAGDGGHYTAVVVSGAFEGCDLLARHRAVYAALGDLAARGIHALALRLYTPAEWHAAGDAERRDGG